MEVIAIILLVIGALAVGTNADDSGEPTTSVAHQRLPIEVQIDASSPELATDCSLAATRIPQRDLTYPHGSRRQHALTDCQKRAGGRQGD